MKLSRVWTFVFTCCMCRHWQTVWWSSGGFNWCYYGRLMRVQLSVLEHTHALRWKMGLLCSPKRKVGSSVTPALTLGFLNLACSPIFLPRISPLFGWLNWWLLISIKLTLAGNVNIRLFRFRINQPQWTGSIRFLRILHTAQWWSPCLLNSRR